MRLIDADVLYKRFTDNNRMVSKGDVRRAIRDTRTESDAEHVVRCWLCVYYDNCPVNQYLDDRFDGFCSDGKRRELDFSKLMALGEGEK